MIGDGNGDGSDGRYRSWQWAWSGLEKRKDVQHVDNLLQIVTKLNIYLFNLLRKLC